MTWSHFTVKPVIREVILQWNLQNSKFECYIPCSQCFVSKCCFLWIIRLVSWNNSWQTKCSLAHYVLYVTSVFLKQHWFYGVFSNYIVIVAFSCNILWIKTCNDQNYFSRFNQLLNWIPLVPGTVTEYIVSLTNSPGGEGVYSLHTCISPSTGMPWPFDLPFWGWLDLIDAPNFDPSQFLTSQF
jgi:hypothetical protein